MTDDCFANIIYLVQLRYIVEKIAEFVGEGTRFEVVFPLKFDINKKKTPYCGLSYYIAAGKFRDNYSLHTEHAVSLQFRDGFAIGVPDRLSAITG